MRLPVGPAHDDPERIVRRRPLQCLRFIPRSAHPHVPLPLAAKNAAAAAARDAELEPVLKELAHLSARAAAAEIEHRGLGKLSYKTIARARVRLGLED